MDHSQFCKYLDEAISRMDSFKERVQFLKSDLVDTLKEIEERRKLIEEIIKNDEEISLGTSMNKSFRKGGIKERKIEISKMDLKNGITGRRLDKLKEYIKVSLPMFIEARGLLMKMRKSSEINPSTENEYAEEFYEQFKE